MYKNKDRPAVIDGVRVSYGESNVCAATRERMMAPIEVDKKKKEKGTSQKWKVMTPEQANRHLNSEVRVRHYIKKKEKADREIDSQSANCSKDQSDSISDSETVLQQKLIKSVKSNEKVTCLDKEFAEDKKTKRKQKQTEGRSRRKGPAAADIPMIPLGKKTPAVAENKKFYPHLTLNNRKRKWTPPLPPSPQQPPSPQPHPSTEPHPVSQPSPPSVQSKAVLKRLKCSESNKTFQRDKICKGSPVSTNRRRVDVSSTVEFNECIDSNTVRVMNVEEEDQLRRNEQQKIELATEEIHHAYVVSHHDLRLKIRFNATQERFYKVLKQDGLKMRLQRKRKSSMDGDVPAKATLVATSPLNTPLPKTPTLTPSGPFNTLLPSKLGVLSPLNTPLPPRIARLH